MSLILKIDYQSEIRGRNKESTLNLEVCYADDNYGSIAQSVILKLQTSRLLTAAEVCRSVYQRLNEKGELKQPTDAYALYWPEEKVKLYNNLLRKITSVRSRCG